MAYSDILLALAGVASGVEEYTQSAESKKTGVLLNGGLCRGLVVLWLKAKREDKSFWAGRGTVEEGLLSAGKRLAEAADLQREYSAANESRYEQDSATKKALGESGLTLNKGEIRASTQFGFAARIPVDQPMEIASKVKNDDSRFFILSIQGDSGAHSIGIYRDWKIFGPDQIYVFDPNFGEFNTQGIENTAKLLVAINTYGYGAYGIKKVQVDLNKDYILWSYEA